jgi:hypothetical protein
VRPDRAMGYTWAATKLRKLVMLRSAFRQPFTSIKPCSPTRAGETEAKASPCEDAEEANDLYEEIAIALGERHWGEVEWCLLALLWASGVHHLPYPDPDMLGSDSRVARPGSRSLLHGCKMGFAWMQKL